MNVSSVKNLNGVTFSAVQDASLTNVVQTNSAQWAEGGAISSYTTAWSDDVLPYGDQVINSLNDKLISAFISNSSYSASTALYATNSNSADYAKEVDETKLVNDGFARNLSSEYGTISVIHNNIIESTNSAISRVGSEGFVSAFEGMTIGPGATATYIWDKALQNTTITIDMGWNDGFTFTYSANTDLTGEIVLPTGTSTQTINIPNATEFKAWSNDWLAIENIVVSAADSFETFVGELAWASALPTYEYDTSTNKISAINGSALTDVSLNNIVQTNSGSWGGSALPISAGPGIKVNLVNNTLVFSNDETVLFETTAVYGAGVCNLSESLKNFERIGVKPTRGYNGTPNPGGAGPWNYFDTDQIVGGTTESFNAVCPFIMEYRNWKISQYNPNSDCTILTWYNGFQKNMESNAFFSADSFTDCVGIQKVIGINRK